jgi:hypothetical protein
MIRLPPSLPDSGRSIARGDVAQLVERLLCKQNVAGSIPVISTNLPFKNSDVDLLLVEAVLGFCPDFAL